MSAKVSILIPVFNTEEYICDCLDSVVNQTFKDIEIIIVDDCGSDRAMERAAEYGRRDSRIKIYRHPQNLGLMMARKTGLDNATGQYVVFLDSDDTLPPESISVKVDAIERMKTDMVISGFTFIWPDKIKLYSPPTAGIVSKKDIMQLMMQNQFYHNIFSGIFNIRLFTTDMLILQHHTMGEDAMIFYQLLNKCEQIGVIGNSLYNYIQRKGSATNTPISQNDLENLVTTWNTQYHYLTTNGLPQKDIYRFLLPYIVYLYYYPFAPEIYKKLRSEIKAAMKISRIYKYIPFKQTVTFIILDKTYLLSKFLRWIFARFRH